MRIVGGIHRGRKLAAPEGRDVRPTSDRARESVFNILEHRLEGGLNGRTVLDVFAGTGAYGLEALSRGARHVSFIDNAPASLAAVRANIRALGAERAATVLNQDATRPSPPPPAAEAPCAVVFLDPPYSQNLAAPALSALHARGWVAADAVVVVEVGKKEPFESPKEFTILDERQYGAARIVFLRPNDATGNAGEEEL